MVFLYRHRVNIVLHTASQTCGPGCVGDDEFDANEYTRSVRTWYLEDGGMSLCMYVAIGYGTNQGAAISRSFGAWVDICRTLRMSMYAGIFVHGVRSGGWFHLFFFFLEKNSPFDY